MNSWPRSLCAHRSVVNDRTSPLEEFPSVSRGPRARGRRSCASNGFFLAARHHFLAEIYRCLEALVDTHAREIQRLAHSFPAPPTRGPLFFSARRPINVRAQGFPVHSSLRLTALRFRSLCPCPLSRSWRAKFHCSCIRIKFDALPIASSRPSCLTYHGMYY